MSHLTSDPQRWFAAAVLIAGYLVLCGWTVSRRMNSRQHLGTASTGQGLTPANDVARTVLAFASQTGLAEQIARQTALVLQHAGQACSVFALNALRPAALAPGSRILLVLSTYGEGDAPDNGALFLGALPSLPSSLGTAPLQKIHYGVLALGDRSYRHFCGFGRAVDEVLAASGAQRLFPRMEVNRADASVYGRWLHAVAAALRCEALLQTAGPPGSEVPIDEWHDWTLASRTHLNPGSRGGEVHLLRLTPPAHLQAEWRSGDVAQIVVAGDDERPRDYSIASIAASASLELLVRRNIAADGRAGRASGWLTSEPEAGSAVRVRLRAHPNFQLGHNATQPLVLIGNGTGIAGLVGHLRARETIASASGPNWLLFGEREREKDFHYGDEVRSWLRSGLLSRMDVAFSRDGPERLYVQHLVRRHASTLREWVASGAAIYVCGSLKGMAEGVDAALRDVLDPHDFANLQSSGRYRRDVY